MKHALSKAAAAAAVLLPVLLPVLFFAAPAFAHDDAWLDTQRAPHGGQVRMAGPYHYELVVGPKAGAAGDGAIVVYVTDHAGTPVATQGATGIVNVLAGKERSRVKLEPDGENRMKGVGAHASAPDARVVVAITLAGAGTEQARFTPAVGGDAARGEAPHEGAHGMRPEMRPER